jgi:phosphatidylserine/phosphatidylglycerophosphate/cardiolipin synthase-like enzyme
VVVVIPLFPDLDGPNRLPQVLGRHRAIDHLLRVAPGRVAAYGLENHAGVPVYVHAKVCLIDDVWASTGSDNFSRRSWTHDSELTAVVLDEAYARDLRLTLAAEHLDRLDEVAERGLEPTMSDCLDPAGMFDAYAASADRLDAWHASGRRGERPPGRLRRLPLPPLTARQRRWAAPILDLIHDPDGRPPALRGDDRF